MNQYNQPRGEESRHADSLVDNRVTRSPASLIAGLDELKNITIGRTEIEMCLDRISKAYHACAMLVLNLSRGFRINHEEAIILLKTLQVKPAQGEADKPDPITNHFGDLIQGLRLTLVALLANPDPEKARKAFAFASLSADSFICEARILAKPPTIQDRGLTFLRDSTIRIESDSIVCESDHIKCQFYMDGTFSAQAKSALMRDLNLTLGACAREFFQRLSNENDGFPCRQFDEDQPTQEISAPQLLIDVNQSYNEHIPMIGKGTRFGTSTRYFGVGIEDTWQGSSPISAVNYIVVSDPNETVLRFIECHLKADSRDKRKLEISRCMVLSAEKCLTLFKGCTETGWSLTVVGPGKVQPPKI